jgi:multidrug efflux pump subunit AcrA (membrane-fusion protein)
LVKVSVTLDQLQDLKVKQGDFVFKGQILMDRGIAYQELKQEQQLIQQRLTLLDSVVVLSPQPNGIKAETGAVQRARDRLQQAEAAIVRFKQNSPYTDLAREQLPLPQEEEKLARLEAERHQAQAGLDQAIAQLNTAQASQQVPDSQNSAAEKAQLQGRLEEIAEQLKTPELVQSPHTGTIKSLRTEKLTNGKLKAELVFALEAQPSLPQPGLPPLPSDLRPQGLPTLPAPLPSPTPRSGP